MRIQLLAVKTTRHQSVFETSVLSCSQLLTFLLRDALTFIFFLHVIEIVKSHGIVVFLLRFQHSLVCSLNPEEDG